MRKQRGKAALQFVTASDLHLRRAFRSVRRAVALSHISTVRSLPTSLPQSPCPSLNSILTHTHTHTPLSFLSFSSHHHTTLSTLSPLSVAIALIASVLFAHPFLSPPSLRTRSSSLHGHLKVLTDITIVRPSLFCAPSTVATKQSPTPLPSPQPSTVASSSVMLVFNHKLILLAFMVLALFLSSPTRSMPRRPEALPCHQASAPQQEAPQAPPFDLVGCCYA